LEALVYSPGELSLARLAKRLTLADPNDAAGPSKSGGPKSSPETMLFPSIGEMTRYTGWWFQTFLMFHNIWDVILPIVIFFKMVKPPSSFFERFVCLFSSDFWRRTSIGIWKG
jgi:hypothetical protein